MRKDLEKIEEEVAAENGKIAEIAALKKANESLLRANNELTQTVLRITSMDVPAPIAPRQTEPMQPVDSGTRLTEALKTLLELFAEQTLVLPEVQIGLARLLVRLQGMNQVRCVHCPTQVASGLHDVRKLGTHFERNHADALKDPVESAKPSNGGTPAA